MTRMRLTTAALLAALLAGACSTMPPETPEERKAGLSVPECQPAAAPAGFAVRLLGEASDRGLHNVVVSPAGIETALAIAAEGSSDALRLALARLFTEEDTKTPWMPGCRLAAMHEAAEADGGVELAIVAEAFADRKIVLRPAFRAALEERFDATAERLDFSGDGAARRINGWVRRGTGGRVAHLVDRLDPEDMLVLASAVHFRGTWARAFDPALTQLRPFRLASGGTVWTSAMLSEELPARYRENGEFQAVELGYGDGGFEFTAVLPREGLGPADALVRLAADPGWLAGRGYRKARGRLVLPRIDLESRAGLLPALKRLGLAEALEDRDVFARMAEPAPALGRVLHAAKLALDERGTEATAATAAVFATRAAIEELDSFEMVVDRPFALAVRRTGVGLLFAAWVADPGTEKR
ncbi:MAG: hypothetical protein OXE76_08745 [Alphaproteobacteria bacterium]|nr:hypothetical protein [Alphaproteobacteria bacterium]